jgi:hypothetical protein
LLKISLDLGMVTYICNLSVSKTEAGGLQVYG